MSELTKMVSLLDALVANEDVKKSDKLYLAPNEDFPNELNSLLEEIEGEACGVFITSEGQPNRSLMIELEKGGKYRVGPGETDSFGWLTGVIYTPVGRIVYG